MRSIVTFIVCSLPIIAIFDVHAEDRFGSDNPWFPGFHPTDTEFPYQARLEIHDSNDDIEDCFGAIISGRWILTSALCLRDMTSAYVTLGSRNSNDISEDDRISYYVTEENIIVHENFHFDETEYEIVYSSNDIALIQLPEPVEFTDFVQSVKLPKIDSHYSSYKGQMAVFSGQGTTEDDYYYEVNIESGYVVLPVISKKACKLYADNLARSQVCVYFPGGLSTCSAYQGAPLVATDESNTLIGILSYYDTEICKKGGPVIFTRVSSYQDWIDDYTGISN